MKKKYYYTYLIIPKNKDYWFFNHIYFGQHSTDKLDDNYICSSTILRKWCKKHPNEFIKRILGFYNSPEELNQAEYNLIHPHLNKEYCLNLREGGVQNNSLSDKTKELIRQKALIQFSNEENRKNVGKHNIGKIPWNKGQKTTEDIKQKLRKPHGGNSHWKKGTNLEEECKQKISNTLKGTKRTEESRKKQGETIKGHPCYIKGKHKVWDNKELNIFHYE